MVHSHSQWLLWAWWSSDLPQALLWAWWSSNFLQACGYPKICSFLQYKRSPFYKSIPIFSYALSRLPLPCTPSYNVFLLWAWWSPDLLQVLQFHHHRLVRNFHHFCLQLLWAWWSPDLLQVLQFHHHRLVRNFHHFC